MIKDLEQRFASAMKKGERFEKQQAKISKEREDIAKASKGKTFMGRPIHELDREQGIVRKKKSPISKVLKKETGEKKEMKRIRLEAREEAYKDKGKSVPLRYYK